MPIRDSRVMEGGGAETFEIAPQGAIFNGQVDQDAAPSPAVILSLDEAEIIAARRLRELAIRLGDGDADNDDLSFATRDVPFNADRMFLDRLAERISSLGSDPVTAASSDEGYGADAEAAGELASAVSQQPTLPYIVTDALPLSAFGHGPLEAKLLAPPAVAAADDERPIFDTASFDAALDGMAANDGETAVQALGAHEDEVTAPVAAAENSQEAARLVGLINEQRTLLNRLTYLSSTAEVAPSFVSLDALADILPAGSWSDAEHLFEAGTHRAEPVRTKESHDEEEDTPPPISAEQLIAALGGAAPPVATVREPIPAAKILSDIRTLEKSEPVAAPAPQKRHVEGGQERAPMIIERARAEMTAIANGEVQAPPARRPSGAIGFAAGLSLSIMVGIALYHML